MRVYAHTVERPAEETVQLREERAEIERRPVDRPVQANDEAFQERAVEVRETAEEPVVGKRARVTEELHVGKRATEREQRVQGTVRETKVDVQRTGAGPQSAYGGPERRRRQMSFRGADRRVALR